MDNSIYVFRNTTLEPLFNNYKNINYSDYDSLEIKNKSDIYIWFYTLRIEANISDLIKEIESFSAKVDIVVNSLSNESLLIVISLSNHYYTYFPFSFELTKKTNEYNAFLYQLSLDHNNIKFVDINQFTSNFSYKELVDMRFYFNGLITYSPKLAKQFDLFFTQKINAIFGIRKKCLVLDLDNVLWGGILGEDGLNKIKLGDSYPGNAFMLFQKYVKQIKNQGVILAICSKNNFNDVNELWEKHPDMILTKEDFASLRINWDDKAKNIKEIAEELNIGLESLVFIDDNPRERELVKSLLPEVTIPEFPIKPYLLLDFITNVYKDYFQIYSLTEEDKIKTQQYFHNAKRKKLKRKSINLSEYIQGLNINIKFELANNLNIARIAQMTQKTNQFNLTTKRYTETDINKMISTGAMVSCARISDKFGDNGITAASIIKFNNEKQEASIDSFMLSCRILGRGIENEFLKIILNTLFKKGIRTIFAVFIPTLKNEQTENFYNEFGFTVIEEKDGIKIYKLVLKETLKFDKNYKIQL